MLSTQYSLQFDMPPPLLAAGEPVRSRQPQSTLISSGEKSKARDIIAAIRTLKQIEEEKRPATPEEKQTLARFAGFGPVALSIFSDPFTRRYKDASWQALGEELQSLLTPDEYESAKRTTFNAFYTSPTVIAAIHEAIGRLGVPGNATILEPGCGIGNFMSQGKEGMRFIGVELDSISGRIAKALHPGQDIRIENFRDTKLPEGRIDAVIGNVPFANLKLDYRGQKFSLHDYFFAKSIDALKPGGVLALVTSHFTLDKQNAGIREYLGSKADFVGAIRLPSIAFKQEGTAVVTDIVFLRKRGPSEPARHAEPDWLGVAPLVIDGAEVPVNRYFLNHPEMVLGTFTRKDTLYGGEGFGVLGGGDLARQLRDAIQRLPQFDPIQASTIEEPSTPAFTPPPAERHITEGSFFVADDRTICQSVGGQAVPVVYGGTALRADGTLTGKRLAALVGLRDRARRVLQSQNEGWPEANRNDARRELNWAYDRFVVTYGPINKTTFGETADGNVIRRMPNLVKFREDPDAMLVMSLEDYDEVTGKAAKAAIMTKDVVGKTPPITHVRSAEEGLARITQSKRVGGYSVHRHTLRQARGAGHRRIGRVDLPRPGDKNMADGRRLSLRQRPGQARLCRKCRPGLRAQRRRLAGRAAGGRAARRHRRRAGRAVDTGRRHPGVCRRLVPHRFLRRAGRPPAKGRRVEHRPRLCRQTVGRRDLGIRHRAGQRHMAPRIGAQHEDTGNLRHDRQRWPRRTGGQPEADVGRPREAETHQGAVPLLGI